MISLYFGLPGAGKTTIISKHAFEYTHSKKSPYKHVYSNIPLQIKGVQYIDNALIGKYDISDGVLLIDEGTLFADSRDFKAFDNDRIYYFMMHRHFKCDIEIYVQQWDAIDRKIRCITDKVFYIYKSKLLLGKWFSRYYRIPYGIIIPDGKSDSQKLGEIVQGYCKPPFLVRLFAARVFRPRWYRYFDSWEHKELPAIPKAYTVCVADKARTPLFTKLKKKVGLIYGKIKKIRIRDKNKGFSVVDISGQSTTSSNPYGFDEQRYSVSGYLASDTERLGTGTDGESTDKETRSHFTLL